MLSGVHQTVFDLVKVLQFFDDGSDFHAVWPCPNYAQKPDHRESPAVIRLRIIDSKGDWLKSMMERVPNCKYKEVSSSNRAGHFRGQVGIARHI